MLRFYVCCYLCIINYVTMLRGYDVGQFSELEFHPCKLHNSFCCCFALSYFGVCLFFLISSFVFTEQLSVKHWSRIY